MDPLYLLKTKIELKKRFEILQNISILSIVIFATFFVSFISDPSINKYGVYYLALITALVSIIYHFLIMKWKKNQGFIYFKAIIDISIIAALIHLTGIFGNYFFFLYFFPLLISSLYLSISGTVILAGLASIFTLLENIYSPDQIITSIPTILLYAFQLGGIFLMTIFARFLVYEITKERKEIEEIVHWAAKVFSGRSPLDNLLYSLGKIPLSEKQKEAKKLLFSLRIGKIVEALSWILGISFLILFALNFCSEYSIVPFISLMIIAFVYAGYHRIIFKRIVNKNTKIAVQIDIFAILVFLFLFVELLGGITSPLALIFPCGILVGSLIFKPYFSFIILGLEILIIIPFTYLHPLQREFVLTEPYLVFFEGISLFVISVFSYYLSVNNLKNANKKEKEKYLFNQLVTNKIQSEAVFQSMGDGMFVVDIHKRIVLINKAAKKMIGWQKGKILEKFYGDILKLRKNGKLMSYEIDCPIQKSISENRAVINDNLTMETSKNKKLPISFYSSPLIDENGDITGGLAIIKDITSERQMDELKNEFMSIASHELNTPISAIEGYLSMVVDENIGKVDKKAFSFINQAYSGSRRLADLIKDLRNISKIYRGKLRISTEPISIEKIIKQTIDDFNISKKRKKVKIEYRRMTKGKLPKVFADPGLMREVITNLIGNAVKFTKEGSIVVTAEVEKNKMIVNVQDSGIGIPKKDIPYIFDRFYRAKGEIDGKEIPGTGLGLYIVKSILKLHGGKIWAESQKGIGSKFSFNLSIAPEIKKTIGGKK